MQHFCHIAFFEVFVRKKRTHVLGGKFLRWRGGGGSGTERGLVDVEGSGGGACGVLFGLERMRVEGGGSLHGLRRGRMGVLPRGCDDADDPADKGLPWSK